MPHPVTSESWWAVGPVTRVPGLADAAPAHAMLESWLAAEGGNMAMDVGVVGLGRMGANMPAGGAGTATR